MGMYQHGLYYQLTSSTRRLWFNNGSGWLLNKIISPNSCHEDLLCFRYSQNLQQGDISLAWGTKEEHLIEFPSSHQIFGHLYSKVLELSLILVLLIILRSMAKQREKIKSLRIFYMPIVVGNQRHGFIIYLWLSLPTTLLFIKALECCLNKLFMVKIALLLWAGLTQW